MPQINLYFPTPIYVEEAIVSVDENIKWADKIIEMQDSITSGGKLGKVIHILLMALLT